MTEAPTGDSRAPRDAATLVLLRRGGRGAEALLVQRAQGQPFAAGHWAFPGGSTDRQDASTALQDRSSAPPAALLAALRQNSGGACLSDTQARALLIAACRETFEECGILLARTRDGRPCTAGQAGALQELRLQAPDAPPPLAQLLEAYGLTLAVDELVYWSNWITPPASARRFDTRFFVSALPEGQQLAVQSAEVQATRWLALEDCQQLALPEATPPTTLTLRELAAHHERHGSVSGLLAAARTLAPMTIMAKVVRHEHGLEGLMPWDADYAGAPGEGVPCSPTVRERLGGFPSRVRLATPEGARR